MKIKTSIIPVIVPIVAFLAVWSAVYACVAMAYGTMDFTHFATHWQYILLFSGVLLLALICMILGVAIVLLSKAWHDFIIDQK